MNRGDVHIVSLVEVELNLTLTAVDFDALSTWVMREKYQLLDTPSIT